MPLPESVVCAYLNVGTKYEIESLRTEAINRLTFEFPVTLEKWDESIQADSRNEMAVIFGEPKITTWYLLDLVRSNHISRCQPTLFYQTAAFVPVENSIADLPDEESGAVLLPDQRVLLVGLHRILKVQVMETFHWLTQDHTNDDLYAECRHRLDCERGRQMLLRQLFFPAPECMALMPWDPVWGEDMCWICSSAAQTSHELGRRAVWEQLPSLFDLPPWEELIRMSQ